MDANKVSRFLLMLILLLIPLFYNNPLTYGILFIIIYV